MSLSRRAGILNYKNGERQIVLLYNSLTFVTGDLKPLRGDWSWSNLAPHVTRCYHLDNMHPVSSNKVRAKILDLGYGSAHRAALCNLSPKSVRILSAAFTNDHSAPPGVRQTHCDF